VLRAVSLLLFGWIALGCGAPPPALPPKNDTPPPAPRVVDEPAPEPTEAEPKLSDAGATESTGIVECDEYLALYQKCEPKLMPEIQAGNRRRYDAERAHAVFLIKQDPRQMEEACRSFKSELEKSCP
jgi:hypothetical protein